VVVAVAALVVALLLLASLWPRSRTRRARIGLLDVAAAGALAAVVLTLARGDADAETLARGEGTFVRSASGWEARSDAEFLLVFHEGTRLPDVATLEAEIEQSLLEQGVSCRPELTATHPGYLRGLRPHIFAYELKACGRVLAGDEEILGLVPGFAPEDIPREDGWRLLSNRIVEMLDWPSPLPAPGDPLPDAVAYRTIKLCLDAATSLLLFQGVYAPTYRVRADRLRRLATEEAGEAPLPLREFATVVEDLTQIKLDGDGTSSRVDWKVWSKVVAWAYALWRFELARLLGEPFPPPADT
jgi:hypothetical protein